MWGGGEMCVISVGWCGSRIRPPLVEAARIRAKSMVFEKLRREGSLKYQGLKYHRSRFGGNIWGICKKTAFAPPEQNVQPAISHSGAGPDADASCSALLAADANP